MNEHETTEEAKSGVVGRPFVVRSPRGSRHDKQANMPLENPLTQIQLRQLLQVSKFSGDSSLKHLDKSHYLFVQNTANQYNPSIKKTR